MRYEKSDVIFLIVFGKVRGGVGVSRRSCFASESSDGENYWKMKLLRVYLQFSPHFKTKTIDKLVLETFNCSLLGND